MEALKKYLYLFIGLAVLSGGVLVSILAPATDSGINIAGIVSLSPSGGVVLVGMFLVVYHLAMRLLREPVPETENALNLLLDRFGDQDRRGSGWRNE